MVLIIFIIFILSAGFILCSLWLVFHQVQIFRSSLSLAENLSQLPWSASLSSSLLIHSDNKKILKLSPRSYGNCLKTMSESSFSNTYFFILTFVLTIISEEKIKDNKVLSMKDDIFFFLIEIFSKIFPFQNKNSWCTYWVKNMHYIEYFQLLS